MIVLTEGRHPALLMQCREAAREGAVFVLIRRYLFGQNVRWAIRASCSDAETLHQAFGQYRPQMFQGSDLWTATFPDERLPYLLAQLFPLQYRRLRIPERWPPRRGAYCFHSAVYVWGPLPQEGLSIVCVGCFRVVHAPSLVDLYRLSTLRRAPVIHRRTPVVDGRRLIAEVS